jgi:outer membrane protein TolC
VQSQPSPVAQAAHQQPLVQPLVQPQSQPQPAPQAPEELAPPVAGGMSLADLESLAVAGNPALRRMQDEAAAEMAKAGYIGKLPDPTVGAMFFGNAMNFVPDSQLAEVQVMQMIPWLGRLNAEVQRSQLEALAARNEYLAERARVVGQLRAAWYKLYVLGKQIAITEAEKGQLQSLINTANARIAAGDAQPGDVYMATIELSMLQEQQLGYRQQEAAAMGELNRLVGRDARFPIEPPRALDVEMPQWSHDLLRQVAFEAQPELVAARMRTAATRWGIEVARLSRRPDLTFGAGWMVMGADPADPMPGAGDDAWTLGVTASVPLWHRKYDAMVSEASRQHTAAHASEDEVSLKYDALLRELWAQAQADLQTVELYEKTILPQARQAFEADQKSLVNSSVTFERVILGYRRLLTMELGYHKALGQLATTLARIRQAVGVDLLPTPEAGP